VSWTQLYRRVCQLEAEMTQRASESRDTATRLERELSQATRREAELTKQLQAVELQLKRTERLLVKPGCNFTTRGRFRGERTERQRPSLCSEASQPSRPCSEFSSALKPVTHEPTLKADTVGLSVMGFTEAVGSRLVL